MSRGDRYIGGISDIVELTKKRHYKNVIICLWSNQYSYKSVIGGWEKNKHCNHVYVENNICKNCGAYIGYVGAEKEINDTYEHIFWIVNQLYNNVDRVIIKSDFAIPTEYTQKYTGVKIPYETITSHHIYNKIIPISNMSNPYKGYCFLTIYQKKNMKEIIKSCSLYCANLCVYDLLLEDCIIVNPDYNELQYAFTKNYILGNSKVVDLLRENNTLEF